MKTVKMEDLLNFRNEGVFFDGTALPLKASYKINKIKQSVAKELEFYSEKFQEIVDTYAQKDENGNFKFSEDGSQILIQDGMIDACNAALEDLQSLEVEIDNLNLTIDDLGDDIKCTPEELEALMIFMD